MDFQFAFKNKFVKIVFWLILTLIFVLSIGGFVVQFQSNQVSYLLHGLTRGGMDGLANDWLANTKDPMPVFNFLVQIVSRYLDPAVFYFFQFTLIAIYLYSIIGITDHVLHIRRSKVLFFLFIVIYLFSYSTVFINLVKVNLYNGIAFQNIAFFGFLPNIFATFLFLSLFLFLKKKLTWSILSLCFAAYFHPGYLISAAVLTTSFLLINFLETKDIKSSLKIGILALIVISPVVINNLQVNEAATANQIFEATRILVEERIPHHTQVNIWWDPKAILKLHICIFALWFSRKSKILPLMAIGCLVTFLPIPVLNLRPSNSIALLQFWRVSVFLVPLSTTILLGYLISTLYSSYDKFIEKNKKLIYVLLGAMVIVLSIVGVTNQIKKIEKYRNTPEFQMYSFITENRLPASIYLIPPKEEALDGFRLETETPIFVDWKSHPWNTVELLEWYERVNLAISFYEANNEHACSILSTLIQNYQITHLVTYADQTPACPNLAIRYRDAKYSIYSIEGNTQ